MSRICLDTSAYSYFKKGDAAAIEAISSSRWIGVPSIVLGELRTGFRLGSRQERNEAELREFLQQSIVETLAVDDEAASIYSEIVVQLRQQGTPLPLNDIWIAAVAAREGLTVVTYDTHFEKIQRVGSRLLS
ncbi:MAG: type II toxin-antitoxin system VapC family toxin [Thermoanaerobaculales bacterium]|jgi:predicted nucleic acid-binding protein|nr:type II toxin-antitoxin system VapC family toxin [Thermoanaerobaculales bacterium]